MVFSWPERMVFIALPLSPHLGFGCALEDPGAI